MPVEHVEVPVEAAKSIAMHYRKTWVIVIANDLESGLIHYTSYGTTPQDKVVSAGLTDSIAGEIGNMNLVQRYGDFRGQEQAAATATKNEELKGVLELFLQDIEGDPRASQFFDLRLIERARAAVAASA